MHHLTAENYDLTTRRRLLMRFREYCDNEFRDPELLYLGGRYAVSLRMEQEARRYLDQLTELLCQEDRPSPAYFAVGLLYLLILPSDDPKLETVIEHMQGLLEHNPTFTDLLDEIGLQSKTGLSPASVEQTLHYIEQNTAGTKDAVLRLIQPDNTRRTSKGMLDKVHKIQRYAKIATKTYQTGELVEARFALESILLLDGDQPDVLRNLITITSEQQDIEGYERYWRRYVRVLLWRIMRDDNAASAWDDLMRFYIKVANVTERELESKANANDITELLRRPGFLPRWLEAYAGLVWLESGSKSRRDLQTHLDAQHLRAGQQGNLELMQYWFQLFYPDFRPFLDIGQTAILRSSLPSSESKVNLPLNPTVKLVSYFLRWAKLQFALKAENGQLVHDRYAETVVAMAGCVARIPIQYYTKEITEDIPKEAGLEQKSLYLAVQEACSFPLSAFRLSEFLNHKPDPESEPAPNWAELADFFHVPDIESKLNPSIRMFLALALCQTEREFEGLQVACHTLPDLPVTDLQPEADKPNQNHNLWQNVLHANIGKALTATELPPSAIDNSSRPSIPPMPKLPRNLSTAVAQAVEEVSTLMAERNFPKAREIASDTSLADKLLEYIDEFEEEQSQIAAIRMDILKQQIISLIPIYERLSDFKESVLAEIENIHLQQIVIPGAVRESRKLADSGEYEQARAEIEALPDSSEDLQKLKIQLLSQIDVVEANKTFEKANTFIEKGDFEQARKVVSALPDTSKELREAKENFLSQLVVAEANQTFEKAHTYIEEGNFQQARKLVNGLPDSPKDLRKAKENFLSQIQVAEINKQIEKAVQESRDHVQNGNFSQARRVVNALPNSPKEVSKIKRQLLAQIDEAEEGSKINEQINKVVEKSKAYVQKGNFSQARQAIRSLPDSPKQVKDIKRQLLSQVDDAEQSHKLKGRINAAIAETQNLVQKGDFSQARRAINRLPDSPNDVRQLKRNLLSQIDDAEKQHQNLWSDISDLTGKLARRGITMDTIARIAQDNNVDITNPGQMYGLLQAIDRQL